MLRNLHFAILPSYCQSGVKSLESSMEAEQNNERKEVKICWFNKKIGSKTQSCTCRASKCIGVILKHIKACILHVMTVVCEQFSPLNRRKILPL